MKLPRTSVFILAVAVCACLTLREAAAAATLTATQTVFVPNWAGNFQLGTPGNGIAYADSAMVIPDVAAFSYQPGWGPSNPGTFAYAPTNSLGAVRQAVQDAYSTGWAYTPYNSATPSAGGTSGLYAGIGSSTIGLGYMSGTEYGVGTLFGGQTVAASNVLIRETYIGDTTLKGYVGTQDFGNWFNGYVAALNNPSSIQDWSQGDFTYTGHTGTQDFGLWFNGYVASLNGTHGPTTQDASLGGVGTMSPSGITATPEPGTICLLGAGMAALGVFAARRRWPRRPTH